MNNAVRSAGEDHADVRTVIRCAGKNEFYVGNRNGVSFSVDRAFFVKRKFAVDTRRVAESPYAGLVVNAYDEVSVHGPVVGAAALRLADVYHAVLVDGKRHLRVILQVVVNAVDLLKVVCASRDIVEDDSALRVCGERYIYNVAVL